MELSPSYKQTEAGVIPEDWEVAPLRDLAVVVTGSTPPTWDATNYGDEFLFVSPADIDEQRRITHTGKRLSTKGFSIARRFPRDSVLFVCVGSTIGKCAIAATELTANQQINAILPSDTVSPEYLYYALRAAVPRVRAIAGQQAVPIVNKAQFSETRIAVPTLTEQRAIAASLHNLDALLEGLTRLIAKKRDLKQAAMQQLLTGQTRLPGFADPWEETRLGDLFAFKNGLNKAKRFFGVGKPIVNFMDVMRNPSITSSMLRGRVWLSADEVAQYEVRRGDVLFTRTSETREEIGMSSVVLDELRDTVFSGFVLRARPKNDALCPRFSAHCFRASAVRRQIVASASYTTRALTNGKMLSAVVVPLPNKPEQAAIASVLSDMDAELAALEARREKTKALKQAMMQALLTGRTRLVAPEPAHA